MKNSDFIKKYGSPRQDISMAEFLTCNDVTDSWNIPAYSVWFSALLPQERTLVLRDNRKAFKTLWGKPSGYFRGEFLYHNYVFSNGILLATAKSKGTRMECPSGISMSTLSGFTLDLIELLKHETHDR